MQNAIFYIRYIWLFAFIILKAQEQPPIQIFYPNDYGAETQNWSITQSKEKYIYVANNKGLLEFNGSKWQLYKSPNQSIIRSVNIIDDIIYTGCNQEFGYWKKNDLGVLLYTSLSKKLNIKFIEDEEFWNIISLNDFILFQSLNRIYIYHKNDQTLDIIESENLIYKIFKVNDAIYFQKTKDGLYTIEKGKAKLISNHDIIKDNLMVNMFYHDNKLLIETEDSGFYILNDNKLIKWNIPANTLLSKVSVYRSTQLKDKSFILGTRSNGIIHLTVNGEIDYHTNITNGLSNNSIHYVFEDFDNNIWLALNNGINCVNINSPFTIYKDKEGKIGTVYASAVFNNNLYLGTNQGLFYKSLESKDNFKFIEGSQGAVWNLSEINNQLFCGHDSGTFVINNNKIEKIIDIQGTWSIKPINENTLLQGNYDGLYIIERKNNTWVLKNKIKGFNFSSKFFEISGNKILVSHEYKGVFILEVNDDFTEVVKMDKDLNVEKELNSSLINYNDNIYYTYSNGVFKYKEKINSFVKDSILSAILDKENYTSGRLVFIKETNTLWSFSKNNLNYVITSKLSDKLKFNKISFSESFPIGQTGYENITFINKEKYLIGTSSGYLLLNLNKIRNKNYRVSINSIAETDLNSPPKIINKSIHGTFKNQENNFEFSYSVPEFEKSLGTKYQYQLLGIYPKWSEWTHESKVFFNNLPYGDYTFNVRAKTGNNISANVASYSFNIERPWFLSNLFLVSYILIVLLFSLFMHHMYKRYYKKQREKLLRKTMRDLELKELENKQQLMRFNNDNLRQDIENKNRELGISTMSLIKKNEFLNSIKKELKNADDTKNAIKHVIKIIDKNLNNTDDWHLFEEAFNNADKDFLKIIKAEHPSLTSNDLRLCAYLRLNLSSKEIAPLLNISSRSVEVKRYRLRKKMNLPHESSLTDYILEI
ncbi:triple tyrosine motif-containing protein [Thalassobellus suaedae]|uniref:Triple tyrosine motif-containing protein n=2 Tax=Thalassobellus suaedae TaxID=3074124 RepID=A0ABY9Y7C5_9FLAO|nr:triple tyrosine motif-containing protein [Flavobacteriaceae bacterium HL-DH10]